LEHPFVLHAAASEQQYLKIALYWAGRRPPHLQDEIGDVTRCGPKGIIIFRGASEIINVVDGPHHKPQRSFQAASFLWGATLTRLGQLK
jgi:hypothetical protein